MYDSFIRRLSKKNGRDDLGQSPISSYSTSNFMIPNFSIDFNTFCDSSFQSTYDSYIKKHHSSFICPKNNCDHPVSLTYAKSYYRYIFLDTDYYITLKVAVYKCSSCGSYHAILPAFLLPYSSYSYPFIIKSLYLFFFHSSRGNKTKVCEIMHISRKTFNHFLSLFSQEELRCLRNKLISHKLKKIIYQVHKNLSYLYPFLSTLSKLDIICFLMPCRRNLSYTFYNSE